MVKVSVLMPVYNTEEKYLREAVESILAQTFTDFELLIINDASTDKNVDMIIRSYKDKRIKYHVNEVNLGITKTRNKLIDLAQGVYLAVMDHDDISLPERFIKQVSFLDANLQVGVVGCIVNKIPQNERTKNPTTNGDIKLSLMRSCAVTHPASMIRKEVLIQHNVRYEERFSPAEDYALWCQLIPYTDFYNIPEVLFSYRCHKNNTSKIQKNKIDAVTLAIQSLVAFQNPALYAEFLLKTKRITYVKLFGFLPVLQITHCQHQHKVLLFGKIPLCTFKTRIKLQEKHK